MGILNRVAYWLLRHLPEPAGDAVCTLAGGVAGWEVIGLPGGLGAAVGAVAGGRLGAVVQERGQRLCRRIVQQQRSAILRTEDIDYSLDRVFAYYGEPTPPYCWLESPAARAPYQIIHDYRAHAQVADWGQYHLAGTYAFPRCLTQHRTDSENRFRHRGQLKQNDRVPRLRQVAHNPLRLELQYAEYYDQVGTNLSIDYPLTAPPAGATTVREWDLAQAHVTPRTRLPGFEESRLANTIGVAVAVTVLVEGKKSLIVRRRTDAVAVYAGMHGPALTFALELEPEIATTGSFKQMVLDDLKREARTELELDNLDVFYPPRPLALCRDLVRGGKPQLFIELEVHPDHWEPIARRIDLWTDLAASAGDPPEFGGAGAPVTGQTDHGDEVWSPETEACLILLGLK